MKLVYPILMSLCFALSPISSKAFQLYCPGDVWLNCHDDIWNLSQYGNAYYEAYGVYYDAGTPSVVYDLTSCNTGKIYRTWTVEDPYWNPVSCTQTIHVSGGYFSGADITWPHQDLQLYGCNTSTHPNDLPYGYDKPRYNYVSCSHIGTSYNDRVFNFGPDCKKIIREWTLIDWCNYHPNSSSYQGIWRYSQIIKVSNTDQPIVSCPSEVVIDALECDGAQVNLEDVLVEGSSCTGDYLVVNNSIHADSNGPNASGRYPIGITEVEYTLEYSCGKEKVCRTDIVVLDKKPAVPYCYSGLNVALMPQDTDNDGIIDDGMAEVWASDLNVGSYHPCNNGPLTFSFSSDVTDLARVFTCEQVGPNPVQMWTTDTKGNQSYCVVILNVQNNAASIPDCQPDEQSKYVLAGKVKDEAHDLLENVQVTMKDREPGYSYITETDSFYNYAIIDSFYNATNVLVYIYDLTIEYEERIIDSIPSYNVIHAFSNKNGVYGVNDILLNRNYEVTAYKQGDMSMVSNEDLEILEAYVNGEYEFQSPYSFIAADINEDFRIDEEDIDILRDLIEGEEDEWPNERQWVFYNLEDMSRMTENPLYDDLSQMVYIENIQNKSHHHDFMGVLKGDLDKRESLESEELDKPGLIENRNNRNELQVYPNPFNESIIIDLPKNREWSTINFYTAEGKLVYSTAVNDKLRVTLNEASSWPEGTYYYRISSDEEIQSGKIIKIQ